MDLKKFVDFEKLEIAFEAKSVYRARRVLYFSTMKYLDGEDWYNHDQIKSWFASTDSRIIKSTIFDIFVVE